MTKEQIYQSLSEVFDIVFLDAPEKLTPEITANDVDDWDSLTCVSLLFAIEEKFGFTFITGEAEQTKNVGELVALIQNKLNERS